MIQVPSSIKQVPEHLRLIVAGAVGAGFSVQLRLHRPNAELHEATVWVNNPGTGWFHFFPMSNINHVMMLLDAVGGRVAINNVTIEVDVRTQAYSRNRAGMFHTDVARTILYAFAMRAPDEFTLPTEDAA